MKEAHFNEETLCQLHLQILQIRHDITFNWWNKSTVKYDRVVDEVEAEEAVTEPFTNNTSVVIWIC
jgi:hypothetical protein